MYKKLVLLLLTYYSLTGCVNIEKVRSLAVADAAKNEPINAITAGCSSLGITRDCDNYSGANKLVVLNGTKMRVASDEAGSKILLMYNQGECGLGEASCLTKISSRNYYVLKSVFLENDIRILEVTPLATSDFITGYLIFTDSDAYSLLN